MNNQLNGKSPASSHNGWVDRLSEYLTAYSKELWLLLIIFAVAATSGLITSVSTPIGEIQLAESIVGKAEGDSKTVYMESIQPRPLFTSLTNLKPLLSQRLPSDLKYIEYFEPSTWKQKKHIWEATREFLNGYVLPIVECAIELEREGTDRESIKDLIRPVTRALSLLVKSPTITVKSPTAAPSATILQDYHHFLDRAKHAVQAEYELLSNKQGCSKHYESLHAERWITPRLVRMMKQGPYIHTVLARLLTFTGNTMTALRGLHGAMTNKDTRAIFDDDVNSRITIAELIRLERYPVENNMKPVLARYHQVLDICATRLNTAEDKRESCKEIPQAQRNQSIVCRKLNGEEFEACVCRKLNDEKFQKFVNRFETCIDIAENAIALRSAEAGVAKLTALRYAESNYKDKIKHDLWDAVYVDTYGYVLMAFAAREDPIAEKDIRKAKLLFEEALARAERVEVLSIRDSLVEEVTRHHTQARMLLDKFRGDPLSVQPRFE